MIAEELEIVVLEIDCVEIDLQDNDRQLRYIFLSTRFEFSYFIYLVDEHGCRVQHEDDANLIEVSLLVVVHG